MNKRTVDEIIKTYDDACEKMGTTFPQMMKELCDMAQKNLHMWKKARTKHGLEVWFYKEPEPTREKLDAMLEVIKLIPYLLRKAMKQAAEKLPPDPGGRPNIITLQEAREICRYIGELQGKGVNLPIALQRAAEKWRKPDQVKIPFHTVKRVWYERNNPKSRFYLGETEEPPERAK